MKEKTLYEILEVSENASGEIIEKAYKTLAKKYHPDLQEEANKKQAEAMYSGNSYVTSELISSYAWDTALNYICQTNEEGYLLATTTDSAYGNIGTDNQEKTGIYETDNYSNIHDILGNCWELTTEYSIYTTRGVSLPCGSREGVDHRTSNFAASRLSGEMSNSNGSSSFRLQLYINSEN